MPSTELRLHICFCGLLLLALCAPASSAEEVAEFSLATAFTYQGRLEQRGEPADGFFDLVFELYDSPDGGAVLGQLEHFGQLVENGSFVTELDFGRNVFSGESAWLKIQVRDAGGDTYATLSPRQRVNGSVAGVCVVDSDVEINGNLTLAASDTLQIGTLSNLKLDRDEIWVSGLGTPPLLINGQGVGYLGVGRTNAQAPLHVAGSPDASPSDGGALVLGDTTGPNLALDSNEIMARSNGSPATLFLNNDGGSVVVGGPLDISYEVITQGGCSGGYITAQCSPGKRVLGGGCYPEGDTYTAYPSDAFDQPGGDSAYTCFTFGCDGSTRAYAISANVE